MNAHADALLSLLEQLRGASRLGRAKILAQAVKALRALPKLERRAVAIEVARQAAPNLVPSLEAGSDLSPAQISQFVQLVQQLDGDQIASVAAAIRQGDLDDPELRAVAAQVASTTLETLAPPTDPPVDLDEPDLPEVDEPDLVEFEDPMVPDVEAFDDEDDLEPTPTPVDRERPADPLPMAFQEPTTERVDPVLVGSDSTALREAEQEIAAEAAARATLVAAAPDGWRRRRLLMDLAREGLIADDEAHALVQTLARPADRTWVAGMLVDRGLATVDDLASLLPDRAATRLRHRMAA